MYELLCTISNSVEQHINITYFSTIGKYKTSKRKYNYGCKKLKITVLFVCILERKFSNWKVGKLKRPFRMIVDGKYFKLQSKTYLSDNKAFLNT